jgi:hypothetical protein
VPAKRRICAYQGDYQVVKEPLLVLIDSSPKGRSLTVTVLNGVRQYAASGY